MTSRRRTRLLFWSVLALLITGTSACDEKLSDIAGPSPSLQPTFTSIQKEIFETTDASGRAACTQCHTDVGRTPTGGLNLRHDVAFANLVNVASRAKAGAVRVVPGDPENSYLLHKLDGKPDIVGERMPRTGGPYLTSGQISILNRWIATGAKND
jgi:hypothetical protein